MDKSTLLNEIVNHANFKDELLNALCGDDTIKDHFYSYDFDDRYKHIDICDELRANLIDTLIDNFDSVKSTFLKVFNDVSFRKLYEFLATLEGSWGYDFNELIGSLLDDCLIDAFKNVYRKCKSDLTFNFKETLDSYVKWELNDILYKANPKQLLAFESVINNHVDNFEFEIDVFASVFNCSGLVCALNEHLAIKKNPKIRNEYYSMFVLMLGACARDACKAMQACEVD